MGLRESSFGPVYIANAAGNLFNPPTYSGGVNAPTNGMYAIMKKLEIVNKDTVARTFTLYKGATGGSAGGTEICGGTRSIPANSTIEIPMEMRFDIGDFLTGVADAASKVTINGDYDLGVAG